MKALAKALVAPFALSATFLALQNSHAASSASCNPNTVGTPAMFHCEGYTSVPPVVTGGATAYKSQRQYFPPSWSQLGYDQRHDPVFEVPGNAPAYLTDGTFWAAPLTGLDFQDLKRALPSVGNNGEAWGSATSQYLGNVVGVSVVQGITFVQNGRREIWAIDTATGRAIWHQEVTSSAGMGQALVQKVNGKLMVFVPVGDAAFTVQNAIDFANGKPHYRGANFAGLQVFDALTGKPLWRYATQGSERPTPVFLDGKLYVTTNSAKTAVLDAATGAELGSFSNPTNGYSGLAAANWMKTADGRTLLVYGTIRPGRIFAVDVTDASAPSLAWSYTPPGATANAPGDTSMAIDPELGLAFTTVFSNTGTGSAPVYDLNLIAIDVASGQPVWSQLMGEGDSPPGYKGSIPMVKDGVVYTGNTLNGTYQAYKAATGEHLWTSDLSSPEEPADATHRPRAASVLHQGKLIVVEGRFVHTLDPATGVRLNRFQNPGFFGIWGVNQPVIIGNLAVMSSISGWVFGVPVDFITTNSGIEGDAGIVPVEVAPPAQPVYYDASAKPKSKDAALFDNSVLAYAGGPSHNSVSSNGPSGVSWQAPLKDAAPLTAKAKDEALYGKEVATQMMQVAYGASSGVSPAAGVVYAGSGRYSVDAINATTGKLLWRVRSQNANFGQPLVTPKAVIVASGDPWLNLGKTGQFKQKSPATSIGDNWALLRAYDRDSGVEKWTVYTGTGTSAMTPLYRNGNLYWVNGQGKVWAVNAETGAPVAPFMNAEGQPVVTLPGFNAISSANIYRTATGSDLMVVGLAMPNRMLAIDLDTAATVWTQDLASTGETTYSTGFAAVSPAVSQDQGLVVGTVLTGADTSADSANVLAYALDASSGEIVWTRYLATGVIPSGFAGITPMLDAERVYFNNPLKQSVAALELTSGAPLWETVTATAQGKFSWGPGVVVDGKLIQPVGENLLTLDAADGTLLNTRHVGGAFVYNHPTVAGETVYIGNSWGWVLAMPLAELIGN